MNTVDKLYESWYEIVGGKWRGDHIEIQDIPLQEEYKPDYVYIMKCKISNLHKIGITSDSERRRQEIQNSCGMPIIIIDELWCEVEFSFSAKFIEEFLHNYFKEKRTLGEWFHLSKWDIKAIQDLFEGQR